VTQGLSRRQLGITDAMIDAYGETIFRLSNNHQIRRGDPVRDKDFAAIDAHRHELGMSDAEIAARIGLLSAQVTFIRNLEERRRFRTGHYHMLNRLGGGRRFRADRMTPFQDHFRYSEAALGLRAALAFDPERVRCYVERGLWRSDTLRGWIERHARERPDAPAIIDGGRVITYAALGRRVATLAAGLYHAGVRPGEVVAVQLLNTVEHLEGFLALSWLGAVMSTLYMTFREADLAAQLTHSRACALIVPEAIGEFRPAEWALAHRGELPHLRTVIVVGAPPAGAIAHDALAAEARPLPDDLPVPSAADPFLLLYTSGTTSAPKGVPLNSHQMLTNARLGIVEHDIRAGDVVLSAAPFGHLYALYSVQMALCAGAAVLLLPRFTPPDLVKTIAAGRASHVFAGPAHLAACQAANSFAGADLASLRLIVLSGSVVPPDLVRAVGPHLRNGTISQLWGMTELQAGLYTRPGDPLERAATSAGRASPGTEVRIADENGRAVPTGGDGELQVRGPSVFAGYYDNPAATAAAFAADGWFRSGDIGSMDSSGNVTLSGRIKDVINRGGVKYNPQEVELLIERHPAVVQCAIVPVADARMGERACCFAVLKPGAALDLEGLCAFLTTQGVAKYKLPEQLKIRAELPLTATRKVIKSRLAPSA